MYITATLSVLLGITLLLIGGKVANIKNSEYPRIPPAIRKHDDILGVISLIIMAGVIVFLIVK